MLDACGRVIDYLRLSVTDRCNLRCRYCMPHGVEWIPHENVLRHEEMLRLCAQAARLGVTTVKVTGGEPLARRDCVSLLRDLKALPGIRAVTLTTNGVLLAPYLKELADLGLDGLNISLDTLDRAQYQHLTGVDALPEVLEAIHGALRLGLRVKLNCVALGETGLPGILALAELARTLPLDVRFIEYMPMGGGEALTPMGQELLLAALKRSFPGLRPSDKKRGFGPARYFEAPGLRGSVGVIDAVSHSFCAECNRVRLTSEGFLKLCLCHGDGVDLRALLRSGAGDEVILDAIRAAILQKPAQHTFIHGQATDGRTMSQIGG